MADLLQDPAEDSPVIATLLRGERVMEFTRREGWVEVGVLQLVGVRGWIKAEALAEAAPPATPQAEAATEPEADAEPEAAALPEFLLVVQPQAARRFRGQCNVGLDGRWAEPLRFSGSGLRSYRFRARYASCDIRSENLQAFDFEVCLFRDGRLISYYGGASVARLNVRSEGPWGEVRQSGSSYASGRLTGRASGPPRTCQR